MALFETHLEQVVPRLVQAGQPVRTDILAHLAVESYFRRSNDRMLEYVAWLVLWAIRSGRLETLSVGIGQIQLRRWKALNNWPSLAPSLSRLRCVSAPHQNYAAAAALVPADLTIREQAVVYRGEARRYHVRLLQEAQAWIISYVASNNRMKLTKHHLHSCVH